MVYTFERQRFFNQAYVAVNFLSQLIFTFPLSLGMVMYTNEFETKEKQKLTEIKNYLQHIYFKHERCLKYIQIKLKNLV